MNPNAQPTRVPSVLAQLLEPPCTEPYARWCGRGGAARLPPIPIDIADPQGDDVATTQLAVDRKVEKGKIAGPPFDQEAGSDRPDLVWPQRRFGSDQLALVPGCVASFGGEAVFVRDDCTPRFVKASSMRDDAQIVSAFGGLRSWGTVGP